jgi:DNA-binding NarL/FixJ family response regulator
MRQGHGFSATYRDRAHRLAQVTMEEKFNQVAPRERQIIDLLLQGCDNAEIARDLNIAERTVKAHFNRLFLRFGIKGGIKRVKLATLLYRRQLCLEKQKSVGGQTTANDLSFNA